MSIVLNKSQLQHISNLIEMKGVKYYDVNMELTDHMASEVEEILNNEHIKYKEAVKIAFLRYNRFHFMKIEEEKEKKVRKQANRLFWRSLLQFFTFPKIAFTAMVFALSLLLVRYFSFSSIVVIPLFISSIVGTVIDMKKRKVFGWKSFLQLKALTPRYLIVLLLLINAFKVNSYLTGVSKEPYLIQALIITAVALISAVLLEIYNKHINTLKSQYV